MQGAVKCHLDLDLDQDQSKDQGLQRRSLRRTKRKKLKRRRNNYLNLVVQAILKVTDQWRVLFYLTLKMVFKT